MTSNAPTALPTPSLTVVPAKPGLPAAGGELDLLVTVSVEHPALEVDRKPLSLALVIDRSGSMSGQPLAAAKAAAQVAVRMLVPGDWVSVVTFESRVEVVQPLVEVGADRRAILAAIDRIRPGGSTNLFGGWAEGLSQVMSCPTPDAVNRVVILSDGMANAGVTDRGRIARDVTEAVAHGVTTTAMGLGRDYDEHLLRAVADAGRGNYAFLADERAVSVAFEEEVAGLSSLRGRAVRLAVEPRAAARLTWADPAVAAALGLGADADGVALPDLVAGLPADYLLTLSAGAGAEGLGLTLGWEDVLTGRREEARFELDLPLLDDAAWRTAPEDARVVEARGLLAITALKRRVAVAAQAGDVEGGMALLRDLHALIAHLPVGETRRREEDEATALLNYLRASDTAMAQKMAWAQARRNVRSRSDEKRDLMMRLERERRFEKERLARAAGVATLVPTEVLFETTALGGTRVQVVKGDITDQAVDAVVNSTSRSLIGVGGVDGALARAGGPEHMAAMRQIGSLDYGAAAFTPAYGIPAKYVIHTAAQPWDGGKPAVGILKLCYHTVFALAEQLGVKSIAFPAIGTGNYGFPAWIAAEVAADAAVPWLTRGTFDLVRLVAFDDATGAAFVAAAEKR